MKPNLHQFSLLGLLLMLTGFSLVAALGVAGGRHWFKFGAVLPAGAVALLFGFRWAIYGDGYCPQGTHGRLLYFAAFILLPLLVLLLAQVFGQGIGDGRTWWWPPER
jgi:hypothetical protein